MSGEDSSAIDVSFANQWDGNGRLPFVEMSNDSFRFFTASKLDVHKTLA